MTARTQYGDLVRQAGQHILAANVALESEGLQTVEAGKQACDAYRDVLHALGGHGKRLFGSDTRLLAIRASVRCDPREAAAARLVDHLAHVGARAFDHPRVQDPVVAAWMHAADSIRAASDLLATHRDAAGNPRTPAAVLLDDLAVRTAGFGELASLTVPVAMSGSSLARRLQELGMSAVTIDDLVPETRPLREAAFEARRLANLGGVGLPLAEMQVARPGIRRRDPLAELEDRVDRLHRLAWQLPREDWVGLCNLADLAAAGVFLNERGAGGVRRRIDADPVAAADLSNRRLLGVFERTAEAWREVHMELRKLRTMTPALPGLRADVLAVRALLDDVAAGTAPARDWQDVVLRGAVRFGEVSAWSLEVFEHQVKQSRVLIPGRFLTGNQVSDSPRLVRIKLKGTLAPVLKENVAQVAKAYGCVQERSLQLAEMGIQRHLPGVPGWG